MKSYDPAYNERWGVYVKYYLPVVLIFFIWVFVGNLFELNYKKEDLTKITGSIINIQEVVSVKRKNSKDEELQLSIHNYPEYFRITDNFKYENIQKNVKRGDEVTIYFRSKYLAPLGMGKHTDIYQLEAKNKVLLDLSKRKSKSRGSLVISSIFLIVFGTIYYFLKRKMVKKPCLTES